MEQGKATKVSGQGQTNTRGNERDSKGGIRNVKP